MNVLVEGWRGINHSFAIVNQFQLLELASRNDINLFHEDMPFCMDWSVDKSSIGLDAEKSAIIRSIKKRTTEKIDVIYRIVFPFRFHGGDSKKIFTFGNSELHNLDDRIYQGPEMHHFYRNNDVKIITPSNWSKVGFVRYGFKDEDVFVVPHGVDTSIFKPIDSQKNDHFTFLSLGAMTWNKGVDVLILAFAEINKNYPGTRLILKDQSNLYGIGAWDIIKCMKKDYSSLFTEILRSNITILTDNLTMDQLAVLYNSCDAYISPYRAEGFNLPPLEAAACGVPVALTGGGATDDYFDDSFAVKIEGKEMSDGNKDWIEPDLDSLVAVMSDLVEKRVTFNLPEVQNYIHNNFSWKKVVGKLVGVFYE